MKSRSISGRIALLAAVVILAVGVPSLLAKPEYDQIYTYYSDDTYTEVVGREYYMCTGTWRTGTTSDYLDISIGYSCTTGEPSPGLYECWGYVPQDFTYCGDGTDNDGDGLVDSFDPGCAQGCN